MPFKSWVELSVAKIPCILAGADDDRRGWTSSWSEEIKRLARLEDISFADAAPDGAVQAVMDEGTIALPLGEVIDIAAESARLEKELGKIEGEIKGIKAKLSNENFTSRAPEHVVEEQRTRAEEAQAKAARISAAIEKLKGAA